MKFLTVAGALMMTGASSASGAVPMMVQCPRTIEMMLLQDASTSFLDFADVMAESVKELIDTMTAEIGEVKASLAIFSDKPVPARGNGQGRGYPDVLDVCYGNEATYPLGNDADHLQEGFLAIKERRCEGGDFPENPFEAMIYGSLDPKVNWTDFSDVPVGESKKDDDGNTILKMMVVVTDDHPHVEGEAYDGIEQWNPQTPEESDGYARFFDEDFVNYGYLYNTQLARDRYLELVKLHKNTSEIDTPRYHELLNFVGPAYYPWPLEHPGTFAANKDCRQYEYPSTKTLGRVLNKEHVLPVVLITAPQTRSNTFVNRCKSANYMDVSADSSDETWMECLHGVYTKHLTEAGFDAFIVGQFTKNREDLVKQVVKLVDTLSIDVSCPELTTAAPETTENTLDSSTTKSDDDTTTVSDKTHNDNSGSTVSDASTNASESSNDSDDTTDNTSQYTSGHNTTGTDNSTDDDHTTGDNDDSTGTEDSTGTGSGSTSGIPPFVPVVPSDPGSNTGTIAGATGGAVAGTAALAGVLYKKFGASLLGHSGPSDLGAVEQVEVPETQVEREAFEEVTMDMFQ